MASPFPSARSTSITSRWSSRIYTTEAGGVVVDVYGTKKGKVLSAGLSNLSDLAFDLYATQ